MASRVADTSTPPVSSPRPLWRRWLTRLFPISNAPGEIPAMDGLRAIAISLVFLFHVRGASDKFALTFFGGVDATFISAFGQMGVLLFFVLSGFLLFIPYARAIVYDQPRLPAILTFYRRRARRILPAYLVAVVIISVLIKPDWLWLKRIWHVISHLTFTYTFSPDTLHSMNGVFWSLGIEVQFYILMPFLALAMLWLGRRIGKGAGVAAVVGAVLALSLLWRWWFAAALDPRIVNQQGDYRFWLEQLPSLLIIFVLGMGCSYVWVRLGQPTHPDRRVTLFATLLGLAGLAALLYAISVGTTTFLVMAGKRGIVSRVMWDIVVGFGWVAVVLSVLLGAGALRQVLSIWPLRALALISYSFYIWHDIIIRALDDYVREQVDTPEPLPALILILFPLCFVFALGYFHFVELPYVQRKRDNPPPP